MSDKTRKNAGKGEAAESGRDNDKTPKRTEAELVDTPSSAAKSETRGSADKPVSGARAASDGQAPTAGRSDAPESPGKKRRTGKSSKAKVASDKSALAGNGPKSDSRPDTAGRSAPAGANRAAPSPQPPGSPGDAGSADNASRSSGTASWTPAASAMAERSKAAAGGSAQSRAASAPATGAKSAAGSGSSGSGSGGTRSAPRRGRGPLLVAIIALILAVIALIGAGWLWYRGQTRIAQLDSRVDTVEQSMQNNVQKVVMPKLSSMNGRVQKLGDRVQSLSGDVDKRKQAFAQIEHQLKAVQGQNARLAKRFDGSQQQWQLSRVASLLEAANQRLQLFNDPDGARKALAFANQSIERIGDPRLLKVRKQIIDEIAAVKALPNPDIAGMSLSLSNLVDQVPSLPLANNAPTEYHNGKQGQAKGQDNGGGGGFSMQQLSRGWHHFVSSVGNALSHMVTVQHTSGGSPQPALMPPDQAAFLQQNLQLELRSARLALLERDTQSYRDSLASAQKWLTRYYRTDDSKVAAMQDQLKQLSNVKLDWQAPDISGSLQALHAITDSPGSAQPQAGGEAGKPQAPKKRASGGGNASKRSADGASQGGQ